MAQCSIDGCDRPVKARGWCRLHYERAQRNGGDPLGSQRLRGATRAERLDRWVDKSGGPDACWPWTGAIQKPGKTGKTGGYGLIRGGRDGVAHRVAYEEWVGPIPEGHEIDHTCHNADPDCVPALCPHRRCCNPAHLEPVSPQVNMARARARRG
jgi:hypothetical protein